MLALLPALLVLAASLLAGARSLRWLGTLGPWNQVAVSGRALIEAAEKTPGDTALAAAAERHRAELSQSLVQARRWQYLGERAAAAAPLVIGALVLLLASVALLLSRRLARDLAHPIEDLVAWAGRLGRSEPLPPPDRTEASEPHEVQVLRGALREASGQIAEAHRRELDAERTRAWGEMARRVAHEMKNPLTPLRLAAHRVERAAQQDAGLREIAGIIREETQRLDDLARGFAALGQPALGPLAAVDMHELLDGLLRTDVPDGIRRSLDVPAGTFVHGHHDALQRAFRNVIRNAVEAVSQDDGVIDVRACAVEGDAVEVVVADNGPGIPDGQTEAIFEPDRSFKRKGTGLGLAIVRQVTAAHGGTATARNRHGRGAEFVIRLPGEPGALETTMTRG